ncbi:hypothetical protein FDF96_12600 [Clostridium botulinum]|nr:hypothetical protein [Clostridium botulinum]NFV20641.1 hypothetical protein [Clostridium botulinum]
MFNNNHIKKTKENQLVDISKSGKEVPWVDKKIRTLLLAESYKRLNNKKAYRVQECGSFLEFKRYLTTGELKLQGANFCKVRLCPMCAWRRQLKIFAQVSKVMDSALQIKDYRFIFLTLTCKNIYAEDVSNTLDHLFKAFNLLTKRKQFKQSVKGWFRALEITHKLDVNSKDFNTYHPHFHVILMVNKSYFNKPEIYISQEKWTNLWQSCLKVDYTPIVNVKAFKVSSKSKVAKSVAEAAKYTAKDKDYLISDNEEMTDSSVRVLDGALANRRLTAFGGELKKIHKELNLDDAEDGDLVNTDSEEELREDVDYIIERYKWNIGYHQYIKY